MVLMRRVGTWRAPALTLAYPCLIFSRGASRLILWCCFIFIRFFFFFKHHTQSKGKWKRCLRWLSTSTCAIVLTFHTSWLIISSAPVNINYYYYYYYCNYYYLCFLTIISSTFWMISSRATRQRVYNVKLIFSSSSSSYFCLMSDFSKDPIDFFFCFFLYIIL